MLYIVATPIGNLSDITFRAVEVLRAVDIIICEDTRVTQKLLAKYQIIDKQLMSYHHHSSDNVYEKIAVELINNKKIAYVTDAGTPGISDPGNKLVEFIVNNYPDVQVVPLPGASAVVTALSVSGFNTDSFVFKGFIPHKKARKKFLQEITESNVTNIFYESVHRIQKLLSEMWQVMPEREIVLARELTKQFESIYRGTADDIRTKLESDLIKGEFVVIVRGNKIKNK